MEIVFDRIHVPHKHSFISRKVQYDERTIARIHSHANFNYQFKSVMPKTSTEYRKIFR